MIFSNLLAYSLQAAAVVSVGALMGLALRQSDPRVRLRHWQLILLACLALPLCRSWQRAEEEVIYTAIGTAHAVSGSSFPDGSPIAWERFAIVFLGAGCCLFLGRLVLGSVRIALYRRRSTPLSIPSDEAEFRLSSEVSGPITFGWRRPVILLPSYFPGLPQQHQAAICEHELVHVRRNDWLYAAGEEVIRAALWFHPAIWHVLARIQLAREQVVDQEAARNTGDREVYLDALLSIAGLTSRPDFTPAPLFLRKRHLAQRVATILHEVSPMNRKRMLFSLSLSSAGLLLTAITAATLLPLRAPAQANLSPSAEGRARSGPGVLYRVPAQYPPDAKLKRIEGTVTVDVQIDARGLPIDARILGGPEELRRAALQSVLQWQFASGDAPTRAEVEINFQLAKEETPVGRPYLGTLKAIEFVDVPAEMKARVAPLVPVKPGDNLTHDAPREIQRAIAEVDPRLRSSLTEDNTLRIAALPIAIRVGGNLQSLKMTKKVNPVYPPEAKQSRLQGTVRFNVRIDKDGKVAEVSLVAGHPLLAESALEAVKQWEYQTTYLNGNPVEVNTQVDVNYTLSDTPPLVP